jgi:hypothetical protein
MFATLIIDGELSGILLAKPLRFDRAGYLRAKKKDEKTSPAEFWKDIPGENLYLPRSKIISLNVSYPPIEKQAETPAAIEAEAATKELADSGIELQVIEPEEPKA